MRVNEFVSETDIIDGHCVLAIAAVADGQRNWIKRIQGMGKT
ncbi:MAG: hypothetical protein VKK07_03165 [Merismopediaceae bacterium]|nr:hypothetical protein [Merismopediaceae bacterium]